MLKKTIVWDNNEFFGAEYLEIVFLDDGIDVTSTVICLENNLPYIVNYTVSLSSKWVVKQVNIDIPSLEKSLDLTSNGEGQWFNREGQEIVELYGATDIDLSCTPFTNTLPINRVGWEKDVSAQFAMVFISVPSLTYKKVEQEYTLLDDNIDKRIFNYRSGSFETNIEVDLNGLVTDYPGIFTRKF